MKVRNKGKVHPSPSSSSPNGDALSSLLSLLPAAILSLTAVLSPDDKEVLAYMITRSIESTNPSPLAFVKKKGNRKPTNTHKPPLFGCECFDCYTSYWCRWDSSPNRELIHRAIEAFEDHSNDDGEEPLKRKGKKRDKTGRGIIGKAATLSVPPLPLPQEEEEEEETVAVFPPLEDSFERTALEIHVSPVPAAREEGGTAAPGISGAAAVGRAAAESHRHKGLARKVLPDVMGLFESRLWSLWSPNM